MRPGEKVDGDRSGVVRGTDDLLLMESLVHQAVPSSATLSGTHSTIMSRCSLLLFLLLLLIYVFREIPSKVLKISVFDN